MVLTPPMLCVIKVMTLMRLMSSKEAKATTLFQGVKTSLKKATRDLVINLDSGY